MAKQQYSSVITADGDYLIGRVHRRASINEFMALVYASGGFGSGTVAFRFSPDGGTTLIPLKDEGGTAASATAAASFVIRMGNGDLLSDEPLIYATVTGSTAATITVGMFDNT